MSTDPAAEIGTEADVLAVDRAVAVAMHRPPQMFAEWREGGEFDYCAQNGAHGWSCWYEGHGLGTCYCEPSHSLNGRWICTREGCDCPTQWLKSTCPRSEWSDETNE